MSLDSIIFFGSFVFFTGLVAVITYFLTHRDDHGTSEGYFLAGRSLTAGYIAGSLLLTNLSTEQLVGLNGSAFADGLSVLAWEVVAGASLVVMALFFLPRYLKRGIATVPQYLEERFDAQTRDITTVIFIIAYACILLPIILYSGARGLTSMMALDQFTPLKTDAQQIWVMVWIVGIIGSIYAIFGGLRSVAVSDTLNGFGLYTGGIMITVFGLMAIGNGSVLEGWNVLRESHPEKFNSLGGPKQSVPFLTLFSGVLLLNLFYWTTNQQIIQRAFAAKNLAEGQKGILLAGFLKVLGPVMLVLPGIIAFHMFQDELPIDKRDMAYGKLVAEVLPRWLSGFFAAVMVGAILSSFNSALNSTATLFSLGVYQTMINPKATPQQVISSGKWCGTIVALLSMLAAPMLRGQESIFGYLQKMNGLYFIPIFAVTIVGMTTRRVPALAAKIALVVGFSSIALGYFVPAIDERVVQRLHEFHFLGVVFVGLIVLMLVIGAVKPRETPYESKPSGDVDLTPWRYTWVVGAAILAFVIFIYLSFADTSILAK